MSKSGNSRDNLISKGVVRAVTSKLNISALGGGALAAVALHSWPLFALGSAAYAALAAWDLASESFWKRLSDEKPPQKKSEFRTPSFVEDAEVRAAVERIVAARAEIECALAESSAEVAAQVRLSLIGLDELDTRAARLVELADGLTRHLRRTNPQALRAELATLEEKARSAKDQESGELYRQAALDRTQELKSLDEVITARERLVANLTRIVSHLEGVPTRVVRVRVLDAASVDGTSDEIGSEIGRMNGELAAIEQTLEVLAGDRL